MQPTEDKKDGQLLPAAAGGGVVYLCIYANQIFGWSNDHDFLPGNQIRTRNNMQAAAGGMVALLCIYANLINAILLTNAK